MNGAMLFLMAGLIFEIEPNLVFVDKNGDVITDVYLVTQFGEFSWKIGSDVSVTRYKSDGTTEVVNIGQPDETDLQAIYDSDPAFQDLISPPDAHVPPWA